MTGDYRIEIGPGVNMGSIANGAHATANYTAMPAPSPDVALQQADRMLRLIREHQAQLVDAEVAEQIVLKIKAQLTADKPDPARAASALTRLIAKVRDVGALATAAAALEHAVRTFFS